MSETELIELKNQLKQEILEEINSRKVNENNWKKIKDEHEEEFKKLITRERDIYALQNAIGILLRLLYKAENVSKIDASYEEMKSIVEQILDVLKQNKKEIKT